jgi:diguanylate cyclase (GGDEF)-like protein/PAS domain S-box-containing protein
MIRTRVILLPLLILVTGLAITWSVWNHERQAARRELLSEFNFALGECVSRVEQRMATYEQMLRGVQGMFAARGSLDLDAFHGYLNAINADANFAGVQAIGVMQWVPARERDAHMAAMRARAGSRYAIRPPGERDSYAPVIGREPALDGHALLGFDGWASPERRLAMEKSRDSGLPVVSAKVQLASDSGAQPVPGFVMYLPVYQRGAPQDNVDDRRAHLLGWVYAAFRMRDVLASLYGEQPPGLYLSIYDGIQPSPQALLYRSSEPKRPSVISANEYLVVGGHDWTLSMVAQDDFKARFGRNAKLLIAFTGAGLSVLLALLAWSLASGRSRALRLASKMTAELRESDAELRIAAVAFDSLEGMMVTDADGTILRVNSAFTQCTGYMADEVIGRNPRMLSSGRHDRAFYRDMWDTIHRVGGWQGEIWDRRKNGEIYPKWLTITAVTAADGRVTHYVGTHYDITERKLAEEQIKELAFFDALTHLPNRTLLRDRLKQVIALSAQNHSHGALLFVDLDNFKTLNDTLGHDKGDLLLGQVARRLLASVREGDTVARMGGDEFVIVLGDLSRNRDEAASETEAAAEKVLAALSATYQLDGTEFRTTASIGATLFTGHETSIDELLKQSDLAMYKSKESGRNAICFFDPAMQTVVMERAALETALRRAIDEDQLIVHYQAQVYDGSRVTGAEALVRWLHPEQGLVPPAEFIPLAEETGLILAVGDKVLDTACRQLAQWAMRADRAHLSIAVNVSAQQLREDNFVTNVLDALARTGADPSRLKLELTESVLVDNVEDTIRKMTLLRAKGVVFSLDDFGVGYSSLLYLKRLPLGQLKIDRSFVRDVLDDPNDAVIARAIVALAQSLGLGVIAEGVETQAQRHFLADAGCYAYQGYLFCRPLPIEAFEAFADTFDSREWALEAP